VARLITVPISTAWGTLGRAASVRFGANPAAPRRAQTGTAPSHAALRAMTSANAQLSIWRLLSAATGTESLMSLIVYGGCIEPEGLELEDQRGVKFCPRCGSIARTWRIARAEGYLNVYTGSRAMSARMHRAIVPTICPA
jgi:hypothetical protein